VKAATGKITRRVGDFYISTLAPVDQRKQTRINVVDVAVLTVLFMEMAFAARLILAN
jgi:hypothetical protein